MHSNRLPYIVFLLVYVLVFGPYFLWVPLPDFQQDTYIYFWIASLFRDGQVPFPKFVIDVPVGFPFFIFKIKQVCIDTKWIVAIQNLLYVSVSCYVIYTLSLLRKSLAWIGVIALVIFTLDNYTMRVNTSLYTEGLYTVTLLLVFARLVVLCKNFSTTNIAILIGVLLLPSLLRPNGIYLFFIVPLLSFLLWREKNTGGQVTLWFSLSLVMLLWSGINYVTKGIFLPSDPYRIEHVFTKVQKYKVYANDMDKRDDVKVAGNERGALFVRNLCAFAEPSPSFYFSYMPGRYKMMFEDDIYGDPNQLLFNRYKVDSVDNTLKSYMYGEYREQDKYYTGVKDLFDYASVNRSKWMYLNHLVYKLYTIFINNILWNVLYFVAGMYFLYLFTYGSADKKISFLLLSVFLLHFVSVLLVSVGHNRFQTRYVHVTEVFLIFSVLFALCEWMGYRIIGKKE